jgi:hypothetical protein
MITWKKHFSGCRHVLGISSPRAVAGNIQVCYIDAFLYGWLIYGCARFAFHQTEEGGFGHKILSPAGIFTVELTTLLDFSKVIQPPKKCYILTDSLSSVKALLPRNIWHQTHSLVYECKQMCSKFL